jgi:ABC-type nitrate/sulfonate/bicarbonate transport system permease component
VGVDVVGNLLGLADGLAVGVALGCAVGVEVVGTEVVRVIVDPLIQFAALGGAQLAYVPWQHSSLWRKR